MSRRVILVIAALCLAALVIGGRLGFSVARLDEGKVIAAYASRYASETGGEPTECVGRPGTGRVWLVVRCSGSVVRIYAISRWGNEIDVPGPSEGQT